MLGAPALAAISNIVAAPLTNGVPLLGVPTFGRNLVAASLQNGVPLLGALPLDRRIRVETDEGKPTVVAEPDGALARAFRDVALRAAGELAARAKDYSRLFPSISVEDD